MKELTMDINEFPKELDEGSNKLYIKVYDTIFEGISNRSEKYCDGTKLPTEEEFATYWNVSRGTVREALYHLIEDGTIVKVQGRRSEIAKHANKNKFNFQELGNPVLQAFDVDTIKIKKNIASTSKWLSEILSLTKGVPIALVIADYYKNDERVATSMYLLPFSVLEEDGIGWENDEMLKHYLLSQIYKKASHSESSICVITDKIDDSELQYIDVPVILTEEFLLKQDKCFIFVRNYLNSEKTRINILRK